MNESNQNNLQVFENRIPLISIVTPAYNEAKNLPFLYKRLSQVLNIPESTWEWIIVDDHSKDDTFAVITELTKQDSRIRGIRFARNFGSHTAITCGLNYAKGGCAINIAADLQDPPEILLELVTCWKKGAQVVWAIRQRRYGEKVSTVWFARLYYFLMRHVVGLKEMPATGADFFLIDRLVIAALQQFNESHVSVLALITWMGFRQTYIAYDKQARLHGQSGWNLEKKLKLVLDSVTSFTYLPIRLMSYMGFVVSLLGFIYAGIIVVNALTGNNPVQGWSSLMVVILVLGGMQMLMMGVLGEYLWRALDESRRRPRYLIEETINISSDK